MPKSTKTVLGGVYASFVDEKQATSVFPDCINFVMKIGLQHRFCDVPRSGRHPQYNYAKA